MPVTANPEVEQLVVPEHGALSDAAIREQGLPSSLVDFSVNVNPLGVPQRAVAVLQHLDITRYPDPEGRVLRNALALGLEVEPDRLLLGNGSVELVWLVALAYLRPGDAVLLLTPTFGEYERVARVAGAKVQEVRAAAESDFKWDLETLQGRLREQPPRVVFLSNPNNPTGVYLRAAEIEPLLRTAPDTLFVIDESYLTFVDEPDSLLGYVEEGNLLLLRSMTKDYALAGLRLGYGIAAPSIISSLRRVQPPWSVNVAAQAAGLAALGDLHHLQWSREAVRAGRSLLANGLTELGVRVFPGAANFLLVEVGDAHEVRAALLRKGFAVRDCTSFGLPSMIRLGVRPANRCRAFLAAFAEVLRVRSLGVRQFSSDQATLVQPPAAAIEAEAQGVHPDPETAAEGASRG